MSHINIANIASNVNGVFTVDIQGGFSTGETKIIHGKGLGYKIYQAEVKRAAQDVNLSAGLDSDEDWQYDDKRDKANFVITHAVRETANTLHFRSQGVSQIPEASLEFEGLGVIADGTTNASVTPFNTGNYQTTNFLPYEVIASGAEAAVAYKAFDGSNLSGDVWVVVSPTFPTHIGLKFISGDKKIFNKAIINTFELYDGLADFGIESWNRDSNTWTEQVRVTGQSGKAGLDMLVSWTNSIGADGYRLVIYSLDGLGTYHRIGINNINFIEAQVATTVQVDSIQAGGTSLLSSVLDLTGSSQASGLADIVTAINNGPTSVVADQHPDYPTRIRLTDPTGALGSSAVSVATQGVTLTKLSDFSAYEDGTVTVNGPTITSSAGHGDDNPSTSVTVGSIVGYDNSIDNVLTNLTNGSIGDSVSVSESNSLFAINFPNKIVCNKFMMHPRTTQPSRHPTNFEIVAREAIGVGDWTVLHTVTALPLPVPVGYNYYTFYNGTPYAEYGIRIAANGLYELAEIGFIENHVSQEVINVPEDTLGIFPGAQIVDTLDNTYHITAISSDNKVITVAETLPPDAEWEVKRIANAETYTNTYISNNPIVVNDLLLNSTAVFDSLTNRIGKTGAANYTTGNTTFSFLIEQKDGEGITFYTPGLDSRIGWINGSVERLNDYLEFPDHYLINGAPAGVWTMKVSGSTILLKNPSGTTVKTFTPVFPCKIAFSPYSTSCYIQNVYKHKEVEDGGFRVTSVLGSTTSSDYPLLSQLSTVGAFGGLVLANLVVAAGNAFYTDGSGAPAEGVRAIVLTLPLGQTLSEMNFVTAGTLAATWVIEYSTNSGATWTGATFDFGLSTFTLISAGDHVHVIDSPAKTNLWRFRLTAMGGVSYVTGLKIKTQDIIIDKNHFHTLVPNGPSALLPKPAPSASVQTFGFRLPDNSDWAVNMHGEVGFMAFATEFDTDNKPTNAWIYNKATEKRELIMSKKSSDRGGVGDNDIWMYRTEVPAVQETTVAEFSSLTGDIKEYPAYVIKTDIPKNYGPNIGLGLEAYIRNNAGTVTSGPEAVKLTNGNYADFGGVNANLNIGGDHTPYDFVTNVGARIVIDLGAGHTFTPRKLVMTPYDTSAYTYKKYWLIGSYNGTDFFKLDPDMIQVAATTEAIIPAGSDYRYYGFAMAEHGFAQGYGTQTAWSNFLIKEIAIYEENILYYEYTPTPLTNPIEVTYFQSSELDALPATTGNWNSTFVHNNASNVSVGNYGYRTSTDPNTLTYFDPNTGLGAHRGVVYLTPRALTSIEVTQHVNSTSKMVVCYSDNGTNWTVAQLIDDNISGFHTVSWSNVGAHTHWCLGYQGPASSYTGSWLYTWLLYGARFLHEQTRTLANTQASFVAQFPLLPSSSIYDKTTIQVLDETGTPYTLAPDMFDIQVDSTGTGFGPTVYDLYSWKQSGTVNSQQLKLKVNILGVPEQYKVGGLSIEINGTRWIYSKDAARCYAEALQDPANRNPASYFQYTHPDILTTDQWTKLFSGATKVAPFICALSLNGGAPEFWNILIKWAAAYETVNLESGILSITPLPSSTALTITNISGGPLTEDFKFKVLG